MLTWDGHGPVNPSFLLRYVVCEWPNAEIRSRRLDRVDESEAVKHLPRGRRVPLERERHGVNPDLNAGMSLAVVPPFGLRLGGCTCRL